MEGTITKEKVDALEVDLGADDKVVKSFREDLAKETEEPKEEESIEEVTPVKETDEIVEKTPEEKPSEEPEKEEIPKEEVPKEEIPEEKEPEAEKPEKTEVDETQKIEKRKELVSNYAISKGIAVEEAEKFFEKVDNTKEKYGNDIDKISSGYLNAQNKINTQEETIKGLAQKVQLMESLSNDEIIIGEKVVTKDQVIKAYRSEYKALTEEKEDDEVFDMAKRDMKAQNKESTDRERGIANRELKISADKKRNNLLNALPESVSQFKSVIEQHAKEVPDGAIIQDNFTLEDITLWAKGKDYESYGDKQYKKGLEDAKVVNIAPAVKGGSNSSIKGSGKTGLSESETKDIKENFPAFLGTNGKVSEKDMKDYKQIKENQKKRKENKSKEKY